MRRLSPASRLARHHRRSGVTLAVVVGASAGLLSGLFGVGGGILIVPGLVLLLGLAQRRAHATSLAAIVPIAVSGAAGYAVEGSIDWSAAALLAVGAAAGTVLGTRALHRVPERGLRVAFASILVATAALLPFEATRTGDPGPLALLPALLLVVLGLLTGVMAGLLGVGGGIVMVPGLVLLLAASQPVAKGTSLLVIVPIALVGTLRNVRHGHADLPLAAVIGLSGLLSAFGGSLLSVRLDPLLSAVLFGLLLLAMAVRLLLSARGRPVPGDQAPD